MSTEQVERKRQEIIRQYGEWTADNFQLLGDVYTIGKDSPIGSGRPHRITQIVSDFFGGTLENVRVADLGSLEGAFAVELARRGAEVVALELREGNLAKSEFAKEVLALDKLKFVKDDVRNFTAEKYGTFDVVLASGILYHLDVPDVFTLVENAARACTGIAIIDTHISVEPDESFAHNGKTYWGWHFIEYAAEPTPEEVEQKNWLAIGNTKSFWLTRASLFNLMEDAGFTSAYECHIPVHTTPSDRLTAVGVKGRPQSLLTRPQWSESHRERCSEEPAEVTPDQKSHFMMKHRSPVQKRLSALPEPVKRPLRALARVIRPKS